MSSGLPQTLQGRIEKIGIWIRGRLAGLVKYNLVVGGCYTLASLILVIAAVVTRDPDQRFPKDPRLRIIFVGLIAILPPIWFLFEYIVHDKVITARLPPEDKRLQLERLKTYQDFVSKLWIAFSAALVFLYFGDYPKKPSPPPRYICTGSDASAGATVTCTPAGK